MKGEKKMKFVVIGAVIAAFLGIVKAIFGIRNKAAFSYDDFFAELERRIDNGKDELGDKFEGGKCTLTADNNSVSANAEMYFIENENWNKKQISYTVPVSHFSKDDATQSKLEELRTSPKNFDIK